MKSADDTTLVGKISNDVDALLHKQIEKFVNKCGKHYLYLNISKTKDMCNDFRKNQTRPKAAYIKGDTVGRVETYKYFGVVLDSKLNWKENININIIKKKVKSRTYCLRKQIFLSGQMC